MKDWLIFDVTVAPYAAWYVKVLGITLAVGQIVLLVFVLSLAARLAWML